MGRPSSSSKALTCLVDGCESFDTARRGMCNKHYQRWRLTGVTTKRLRSCSDEVSRFWGKVDLRSPYECWPWRGSLTHNGYGRFTLARRGGTVRAHRYMYELVMGLIPEGLTIDHVKDLGCSGYSCVNPHHLEAVTMRTNVLRGNTVSANNFQKTECVHGHPFDDENTMIDNTGARQCRICARRRTRENRLRRAAR